MKVYSENRKARFDYLISETFEAGIVLSGQEVKSVRQGQMDLSAAHALLRGAELWLLNATIPPYQPMNIESGYTPDRNRKLLIHKEEIKKLFAALKEKGLLLIPLSVYDKNGLIKISLGLARKKKKADQREDLKKKAAVREMRREK